MFDFYTPRKLQKTYVFCEYRNNLCVWNCGGSFKINQQRQTCLSTVSLEQVFIIIIGHTLDYNKLILCAVDSLIW